MASEKEKDTLLESAGAKFGKFHKALCSTLLIHETRDSRGRTPVHVAVDMDRPLNVKWLLFSGLNVNAQDKKGNTPLHLAATDDNKLCAAILLENGADKEMKNKYGETPYQAAEQANCHKLCAFIADWPVDKLKTAPVETTKKRKRQKKK